METRGGVPEEARPTPELKSQPGNVLPSGANPAPPVREELLVESKYRAGVKFTEGHKTRLRVILTSRQAIRDGVLRPLGTPTVLSEALHRKS